MIFIYLFTTASFTSTTSPLSNEPGVQRVHEHVGRIETYFCACGVLVCQRCILELTIFVYNLKKHFLDHIYESYYKIFKPLKPHLWSLIYNLHHLFRFLSFQHVRERAGRQAHSIAVRLSK